MAVAIGHIGLRTRVRILTCLVATATGHKPFPSFNPSIMQMTTYLVMFQQLASAFEIIIIIIIIINHAPLVRWSLYKYIYLWGVGEGGGVRVGVQVSRREFHIYIQLN